MRRSCAPPGYCARPVRLRGTIETCDGHGHKRVWSTDTEPDGVLRKACGNRREAVCPPCAERYRGDAYQLIAAGLRAARASRRSVAAAPGGVRDADGAELRARAHAARSAPTGSRGAAGRAATRRSARTAAPLSCGAVHDEDDACLGEPLCLDCWDYAGAVVWNNTLGELWRYTTIYLPRELARLAGMTQKRLRQLVRASYVKVAEYQQRGLVHLHVLIRLDRAMSRVPRARAAPAAARASTSSCSSTRSARPSPTSARRSRTSSAAAASAGARARRPPRSTGRAARDRRLPGQVRDQEHRAGRRPAAPRHRHERRRAPVREHVRTYMRAAFALARRARRCAERASARARTPSATAATA